MWNRSLVFVSSTSDLKSEREAIAEGLRGVYEPYLYEEDPAAGKSVVKELKDVIGVADVFLGILGPKHGAILDGQRSFVEWEYDTARTRRGLEIMMFRKVEPTDPNVNELQKSFLERVLSPTEGVRCPRVATAEELQKEALRSLGKWSEGLKSRLDAEHRRDTRRLATVLWGGIALAFFLSAFVAIPALGGEASGNAKVAVWLVSAVVIFACGWLLLPRAGAQEPGV